MKLGDHAASGRLPHNKASQEQADAAIENLVDLLMDSGLDQGENTPSHQESAAESLRNLEELIQTGQSESVSSDSKVFNRLKQSSQSTKPADASQPPTPSQQQSRSVETRLAKLEQQIQASDVNSLIPLIVELLELKQEDLHQAILKVVVPAIDDVITQKNQQDPQKLSAAIAAVLPGAITHQIKNHPEAIAKAIAPEVALSIREQIRLDREAISNTLGPEMGQAIKVQIVQERDAMVDALYPVIGNTISKYMVEVVKSINEQVESALSIKGVKRKIRAKLQGVSEAELILQEAVNYEVVAVLLIQKASGLVIYSEVQPDLEPKLEADLLAGMLTAIRNFANDCIARQGKVMELSEIEYEDSKIILEVAGYGYLAVLVKGEPPKRFIKKIQDTLSTIVLKHDRFIQEYDGDPTTVPEPVSSLVQQLLETEEKKDSNPTTLIVLLVVLLSAVVLPWGFIQYRSHVAHRVEAQVSSALDAAPALSVYHLIPHLHRGTLTLTGRVPSRALQAKAGQIASATVPNLELDNQVVAVDMPPDPGATAAEVERVTKLLNQRNGVNISTRFSEQTVTIEGTVANQADAQQIAQAFQEIPGVRSAIATVQIGLPSITTRIYFNSGSAQILPNNSRFLSSVEQVLAQNPGIHLRIIGHSDSTGQTQKNRELALERASNVKQALIERGIDPARLHSDVNAGQPELGRFVRFEAFVPS